MFRIISMLRVCIVSYTYTYIYIHMYRLVLESGILGEGEEDLNPCILPPVVTTAALLCLQKHRIHDHTQIFSTNTCLEMHFYFLGNEFLRKNIKALTSMKQCLVLEVPNTRILKLRSSQIVFCVSRKKGFIREYFQVHWDRTV